MNVFDNFKEINGKIVDNSWVEWDHFSIPNQENWFRTFMRALLALFEHCMRCSALDGCYFAERNIPKNEIDNSGLLHPYCDCQLLFTNYLKVQKSARAECDVSKFSNYIFGNNSKGKKELFESWGYNIDDSERLKNIFCEQAKNNYIQGNYLLKDLDSFGQRLSIPVSLGSNTFYSGWMLHPEGLITNTTPFGGWII